MAFLNTSSNLFIGLQELNSLVNFLDQQGFRKFIIENSSKFGLINNKTSDANFMNGKVEAGTNSGTIKIGGIEAIDSDGLFVVSEAIDNIAIQESTTQFYWIRIRHKYTSKEKGKVSIDASGNISGIGTEFLSKLRGQPDYPSKLRFLNSNNNPLEYTILSVLDDNNAILQGFFNAESNLEYEVVGTYTPGVVVPNQEKFPFKYDSIELLILPGGEQPPTIVNGKEFDLARVRNNNGVLIIEDKRTDIWQTIGSFELKNIPSPINKFIGVEAVKFSDEFSTKDKNIVELAWGLRSSNWTASNSLRQITISNGQGGAFKRDQIVNIFTNGDFNGWRLYFENGSYSTITESAIDSGAIKVTLDRLIPEDYLPQQQIFIAPAVEEVIIELSNPNNSLVTQEASFPVNTPLARIPVVVSSDETYKYSIKYRYKNNNQYSVINSFPNSEYFAEASFDAFGNLLVNPSEWDIKTLNNSEVELVSQIDSFKKTISRVDKGDKYGVKFRSFNNSNPLISLTAGSDEFYQKIQYDSPFVMVQDQIINLSSEAKDGNEFFLFLKGPFLDSSNTWVVEIRQDYVNIGNKGSLIYTIESQDLNKGGIIIFAVFDAKTNTWSTERLDQKQFEQEIGEIVLFSGNTSGKFSTTGLGVSSRWLGWAICNGQNGTPDLRERFLVGFNPTNSEFQMGSALGQNTVNLSVNNLPSHSHLMIADVGVNDNPGMTDSNQLARVRDGLGNGNYALAPTNLPATVGKTSSTGNNQPVDNRPAYYALAFVMKIA